MSTNGNQIAIKLCYINYFRSNVEGKIRRKGEVDLAIGFLDRAARMDPNNYHAHYFLGRAYQEAGVTAKADREFEVARSLLSRKNAQMVEVGEVTRPD